MPSACVMKNCWPPMGRRLLRFPKDRTQQICWLQNLNIPELLELNTTELCNKKRVCDRHFRAEDIISAHYPGSNNRALRPGSVPMVTQRAVPSVAQRISSVPEYVITPEVTVPAITQQAVPATKSSEPAAIPAAPKRQAVKNTKKIISTTQGEAQIKHEQPDINDEVSNQSTKSVESTVSYDQQLCHTCQKDFVDRAELLKHLLTHVKQPKAVLQRCDYPALKRSLSEALKFCIRTTNNNSSIVHSRNSPDPEKIAEVVHPPIPKLRILLPEQLLETSRYEQLVESKRLEEKREKTLLNGTLKPRETMVELHSLPNESQRNSFSIQYSAHSVHLSSDDQNAFYPNDQSAEKPLHLEPKSGEKEAETHNNLLQSFLNYSVETIPKDSGSDCNETEYISLERLADELPFFKNK